MRQGKEGKTDDRQTGQEADDANPRLWPEQAAEREENGQHAQNCNPGGGMGPERDAGQGGHGADAGNEPGSEQPGRGGRKTAQEGNGQQEKRDPIQGEKDRYKQGNGQIHQERQEGQLLIVIKDGHEDAQLGTEDKGHGAPEAGQDPSAPVPAKGIQRIQIRGDERDAQEGGERQLEGDTGELDRGPEEQQDRGGTEQMQAAAGAVQDFAAERQQEQQGSPDHRRIEAAEGTISQEDDGIEHEAHGLAQLQQTE